MINKIARFRTSSHNLRIETGRHQRPQILAANRVCEKCDLNEVEDEIHCLIVCPNNSLCRNDLFLDAIKYIDNFIDLDEEHKK